MRSADCKNWYKQADSESESYNRRILHHSLLAMSWYGFRPGEMRQIEWRDVRLDMRCPKLWVMG